MITAPGMYMDVPIGDYVADPCKVPSLSSSIATILIERSPAHAFVAHPRLTPRKADEKFEAAPNFGSAVHAAVFGGPMITWLDAADWRRAEVREARDKALREGTIPLLQNQRAAYEGVVDASYHALVAFGASLSDGAREATVVWHEGDAWCRARPDYMSARTIVDLKVTGTNARDANKQFFSQGYDMQAAFLERAADTVDPDGRGKRRIIYLFVEDEPPFAAVPLVVSEGTLQIARKKYWAAVNTWRQCMVTGRWPAYPLEPQPTQMPGWAEAAWLDRELSGNVNVEAA